MLLPLLCLGSLESLVLVSTCSFVHGLMSIRPLSLLLVIAVVHCCIWNLREWIYPKELKPLCCENYTSNRSTTTQGYQAHTVQIMWRSLAIRPPFLCTSSCCTDCNVHKAMKEKRQDPSHITQKYDVQQNQPSHCTHTSPFSMIDKMR